jgi:hypothetical protein
MSFPSFLIEQIDSLHHFLAISSRRIIGEPRKVETLDLFEKRSLNSIYQQIAKIKDHNGSPYGPLNTDNSDFISTLVFILLCILSCNVFA